MSKGINTFLIISGCHLHENEFKTSSSQNIYVRSAIFDNLFFKMETVVLMLIMPLHKFMMIFWHHTSRVIVVYIGETIKDNLLILAFVEEMRKVSFGQLGKIESFWNFGESHWDEIHRVNEFHLQLK